MDRLFRLLLVLLLCVSAALTQETPAPQLQPRTGEPARVESTHREIALDVQVTDKSGAPVRGLQQQDFTILDDKRPQGVVSFHAVDNGGESTTDPVQVVLVVDAVNAAFNAVTYERGELKKFLLQNGGHLALPVSLVVFTDAGAKVQQGSSRDGNALAALYDQYQTGLRTINRSQGFYGANERFDLSLRTLNSLIEDEGKLPGRKLMVWFSPGWPLLSGPNIELTSKDSQRLFNSVVAFSDSLRQSRITLYAIDPLGLADAAGIRTSYYKEFLKGLTSPARLNPGNLGLQVLVVQSGGLVLNSSNDLTTLIANCAADANSFYVLSFDAAKADRVNEYHAIVVNVDKPGIRARTRTGYYAQP
ncbi:MAG: VWA domain-containing protein [Candidatus Sulfotelmatobacter sp.]